jgi:hypothetical protein
MLAATGVRDSRIDWLRGLALASIFINHMPGNRFENWTTRNFGFSDAAEVFVLLAGVAAAFAFFGKFERGEREVATSKITRRIGTLYAVHLASTVAAVALFWLAATSFGNPGFLDLIGVTPLVEAPLIGVIGLVTGGYQLGYFNILPMYVVLMVMLPGLLWLAVRDVRLMLAVSIFAYVVAQVGPVKMPSYPTDGGWFFNPFGWQLLYATGLALGIMRMRGQSVPYHRNLYILSAAYVVFSAVWMVYSLGGHVTYNLLPGWMDTLHKSNLPLTRYLHVLALAYLLVHSRLWQWLTPIAQVDPVLTRFGRHSLPVFAIGSLASMVGYIVLVQNGEANLMLEIGVIAFGLTVMWFAAIGAGQGIGVVWQSFLAQVRPVAISSHVVPGVGLPLVDETVRTTPTSRRK